MTPLTIELPPDIVDAIAVDCARSRQRLGIEAGLNQRLPGLVVPLLVQTTRTHADGDLRFVFLRGRETTGIVQISERCDQRPEVVTLADLLPRVDVSLGRLLVPAFEPAAFDPPETHCTCKVFLGVGE